MAKKYNFEMGKLLDLYKNDIDKWREYLYDNLSVFSWWRSVLNIWYAAKDIYNDIFLVIDWVIIKSLDKFDEKQIYKYIKTRVRWELINRKNKSSDEVWNHLIPNEIENKKDWLDILNNEYLYNIISNIIIKLEEPYKTIMLLYHMCKPKRTFKQIWLTLWCSEQQVSSDYNKAVKFIQNILQDENIN